MSPRGDDPQAVTGSLSSSSLSPGLVVHDNETSGSCCLPKQPSSSSAAASPLLYHDNHETTTPCQTQWTLPPPPPPHDEAAAVVHPAIREEWQQCWHHAMSAINNHHSIRGEQQQHPEPHEEEPKDGMVPYLFLPTACMGVPDARYLLQCLDHDRIRQRRPLHRVELDSLQGPTTTPPRDAGGDRTLWHELLVQFLRESATVGLACDPRGGLMDTNVSWSWIRALSSLSSTSIRQWELGLDLRYPCTFVSTLLQQQQQQQSTVSATNPRTSHSTGVFLCLLDRTPRRIQTDSSSSSSSPPCSNLERLAQALEPVTNLEQVHFCYFKLDPTTPSSSTDNCVEEDPTLQKALLLRFTGCIRPCMVQANRYDS